jgi:hypothetical protein
VTFWVQDWVQGKEGRTAPDSSEATPDRALRFLTSSAVNHTAEHHKPLFWRRLATKLSPLIVPRLFPSAINLENARD